MAKETVEAIRSAELDAERIEKEGAEQAKQILASASQEAKRLISEASAQAESEKKALWEKEEEKLSHQRGEAMAEIDAELGGIRETVRQKSGDAVRLILSQVIG